MNTTFAIARRLITCIKTRCQIKRGFIITSEVGVRKFSFSSCRNMKLVQFVYNEKPSEIRVGYLEGDKVVDINKADSSLPSNLLDILKNGDFDKVKKLKSSNPPSVPLPSVKLAAPIHGNDKVLCIGLNYKDHCEEQNLKPPEVPMIFSKFSSTIIGQKDAVKLRTDVTNKVDWEVELTVVIGKKASNVKAADAFDYVLGYTVAQDISARDWQKTKNGGQFLLGKSMDTFCPIGPCITTSDEIGDPQNLSIKCSVNGVLKQSSNTNQLVHKIQDVIERLSSIMTLLPGDIILTGTPGGVGMYRSPPEYLKPGDVIHSEIQNIGVLETRVEKF